MSLRSRLKQPLKRLSAAAFSRLTNIIYDQMERVRHQRLVTHTTRLKDEFQSCGTGVEFKGTVHITDPGSVVIGNNVHIGDNAFFSAAGGLVIGDNVHISRNVSIYTANHNYVGQQLPYDDINVSKPVAIEKNVWIGMNVSIVPGVHIGEGAIVDMGTVVTQDVPPLAIVGNAPQNILKMRDKDHYQRLEGQKRYGGANGKPIPVNEIARWAKHLDDPEVTTFFVVTTGRSGSRTIARVLSQHSQIGCKHEPRPQFIRLSTELAHSLSSEEQIREELTSIYKNSTSANNVYGECDQKLFNLIPFIDEIFPNSKFIWLLRDGRSVVSSAVNRQWFTDYDLEIGKPTGSNIGRWRYYRLNGYLCGEFSRQEWEQLSVFERNCWYWSYVNNQIGKNLKILDGDRWMAVKLEELEQKLDEILSFLGVQHERLDILHENRTNTPLKSWDAWSVDEKAAFQRQCEAIMDVWYPNWND